MDAKIRFAVLPARVVVCFLIINSCVRVTPSKPKPMPIISSTPSPSMIETTSTMIVTSALSTQTPRAAPDTVFSDFGLEQMNTPSSANFCEHIPPPETSKNPGQLSLFAGRFSLCVWTAWQFLVNTVMDIDQGTLVSAEDINGDIAMAMAHQGLDGITRYYVIGFNKAQIDEIDINNVSYSQCESQLRLLGTTSPGVLNVHEGAVACVKTTENQIALIRVENIYPPETQGVGFSFAVLKKQSFIADGSNEKGCAVLLVVFATDIDETGYLRTKQVRSDT